MFDWGADSSPLIGEIKIVAAVLSFAAGEGKRLGVRSEDAQKRLFWIVR